MILFTHVIHTRHKYVCSVRLFLLKSRCHFTVASAQLSHERCVRILRVRLKYILFIDSIRNLRYMHAERVRERGRERQIFASVQHNRPTTETIYYFSLFFCSQPSFNDDDFKINSFSLTLYEWMLIIASPRTTLHNFSHTHRVESKRFEFSFNKET